VPAAPAPERASALAIDLDAVLGDTRPLWEAWLEDVSRRAQVDPARLDEELPNWRALLERFAEDRAPVYLRPNAQASAALRRLQADGVRLGVFTEAPEELARIAVAQLGAARRIEALEAGPGSLDRLLAKLGPEARVVRALADLHS
jgi:phosphoglycolate phosphatase-like HAD superfamily hydrolase